MHGFFLCKRGSYIWTHCKSFKSENTFYDQILQSFNDLLSNMFGGNFKIPSPSTDLKNLDVSLSSIKVT